MLEPKTVEIAFVPGVDESANREGASKGFLALENLVYRDTDSVARRNGLKRVATWAQQNDRGLCVAGKSVAVVSGQRVRTFDPSQGGLVGRTYTGISSGSSQVSKSLLWGGAHIESVDHALQTVSGVRYQCVVWTQRKHAHAASDGYETVLRVLNYDTGALLLEKLVADLARMIKVVPITSGFLFAYTTGAVAPYILTYGGVDLTSAPPSIVGGGNASTDVQSDAFDLTSTGNISWLAFSLDSTSAIRLQRFSGLSTSGSSTLSSTTSGSGLGIAHIAASSHVCIAAPNAADTDILLQRVTDDAVTHTTVDKSVGGVSGIPYTIGLIEDASSRVYVGAGILSLSKLQHWIYDTGADTVTALTTLENTLPVSRPFRIDPQDAVSNTTRVAAACVQPSAYDSGYRSVFVLGLTSGGAFIGATAPNNSPTGEPMAVLAFDEAGGPFGTTAPFSFHLPHVLAVDTYKRGFALRVDIALGDAQEDQGNRPEQHRCRVSEVDFGNTFVPAVVTLNDTAFIAGSLLRAFDGAYASEAAFLNAPARPVTSIGSAGSLTGSYAYVILFESIDAQGNIRVSPPSPASTPIAATADQIDVFVSNHIPVDHTTDTANASARHFRVKLYRTQAGGSTFNLVKTFALMPGSSLTYSDNFTDAAIASLESLYTTGGVLESEPAPPLSHLCAHRNRLFGIRSDDPRTIAFTQETFAPFYPRWHAALTFRVDNEGGHPNAVAGLDDKLVVFQDNHVSAVVGEGPDSVGNGAYSRPEVVARGVGVDANNRNSVVVMPGGIMFRHSSGIYLLSRDLQVAPVGLPIRRLLGTSNVLSARFLPSLHQVWIFLDASAPVLVFDTLYGRWSTFTSGLTKPRDVVEANGVVYVLDADGTSSPAALFQYDVASFVDKLDGSTPTYFAPVIKTPWFRGAGRGGTQRLRKCTLNGEVVLGTGISVTLDVYSQRPGQKADKDPETRDSRHTWTAGQLGSLPDGGFELVGRTVTQRCSAFRCDITMAPSNTDSEGLRLTALSYDYGVEPSRGKAPLTKKPAAS